MEATRLALKSRFFFQTLFSLIVTFSVEDSFTASLRYNPRVFLSLQLSFSLGFFFFLNFLSHVFNVPLLWSNSTFSLNTSQIFFCNFSFYHIILYIYIRICACIVHILQLINLILLRMCSWFWCCNYRFSFTRACEVGLGFRVCGFIQFCSLLLSLTRVYLDLFVFSFIFSSSNSFADLNPCLFFFFLIVDALFIHVGFEKKKDGENFDLVSAFVLFWSYGLKEC